MRFRRLAALLLITAVLLGPGCIAVTRDAYPDQWTKEEVRDPRALSGCWVMTRHSGNASMPRGVTADFTRVLFNRHFEQVVESFRLELLGDDRLLVEARSGEGLVASKIFSGRVQDHGFLYTHRFKSAAADGVSMAGTENIRFVRRGDNLVVERFGRSHGTAWGIPVFEFERSWYLGGLSCCGVKPSSASGA